MGTGIGTKDSEARSQPGNIKTTMDNTLNKGIPEQLPAVEIKKFKTVIKCPSPKSRRDSGLNLDFNRQCSKHSANIYRLFWCIFKICPWSKAFFFFEGIYKCDPAGKSRLPGYGIECQVHKLTIFNSLDEMFNSVPV